MECLHGYTNPKISIIIPVYNVETYLSECLDSVINQTLHDIEIICINDGSTDNSLDILKEYSLKDCRVKIINKINSGYGHSMNIGIANAAGEYIGIIESDDFAELNMFEELYNLAKNNNADIVKSDWFNYWAENNKNIKANMLSNFETDKVINTSTNKALLSIQPSVWSAIYRRDFLTQNGISFLETPGASYQDTSFYIKSMMMAESVKITNSAYVHYRQDNMNASCKCKSKIYCICDEYDEVQNYMQKYPEKTNQYAELLAVLRYRAYWWNLKRIDKSLAQEFINRFQRDFKIIYDSGLCQEYFFKRNRRKEFFKLMNDKEQFFKIYKHKVQKDKFKEFINKVVSLKQSFFNISILKGVYR